MKKTVAELDSIAVIAHMRAPIQFTASAWLTLDSLLSAVVTRNTGVWRPEYMAEIPLESVAGLFCASAGFAVDAVPDEVTLVSAMRYMRGDFERDPRKRILTAGGDDKPCMDRREILHCPRMIWFARGDADRVMQMLKQVDALGKRIGLGYGAVDRWEVVPAHGDHHWILPDGSPARPIPVGAWETLGGGDWPVDVAGWKPEYWQPENQALCALPNSRVMTGAMLEEIAETMPGAGFRQQVPDELTTVLVDTAPVQNDDLGTGFFWKYLGRKLAAHAEPALDAGEGACRGCGSCGRLFKSSEKSYVALCERCYSIAGRYSGIVRPGRMGAGWAGLITPDHALLVTSVPYPAGKEPLKTAGVDVLAGKSAREKFLRDVLLSPTKPPFLLFSSSNSSVELVRGLRVTHSLRRVYISGQHTQIIDAILLREQVEAWRASKMSVNKVRQAVALLGEAAHRMDEAAADSAREQLQAMREKDAACNRLLDILPLPHQDQWDVLRQVLTVLEKEAKAKKKKVA